MALNINTNLTNNYNGYLLDAKNVKGTYVVVANYTSLASLPSSTVVKGSLAYCQEDDTNHDAGFYQYSGSAWVPADIGSSEGEGGLTEVTVEDIDSGITTAGYAIVSDGEGGAEWAEVVASSPDGTNALISNNKISTTYLPDVILGQLVYGGTVTGAGVATLSTNAQRKLGTSNSSITLTNDTTAVTGYEANEGIYYVVSSSGSFASLSLVTGDWLVSTGNGWEKIDNTDEVTSVQIQGSGAVTSSTSTAQTGAVSTTISVANASTSSAGLMPQLASASVSAQSQSTKFLREDGAWAVPSYTDTPSAYSGTSPVTVSNNVISITPSSTNGQVLKTISGEVQWGDIPAAVTGVTDVTVNGTSVVSSGTAALVTDGTYNASTNKIATESSIPEGDLSVTISGTGSGTTQTLSSIVVGETTYNVPAGSTATDVKINNTSIVNNGVANIVTETAYDASTNKIATMSDVPTNKSAASGGTDTSLVTTGDKYSWNNKQDAITFNTAYNSSSNKAATMSDINSAITGVYKAKGGASYSTLNDLIKQESMNGDVYNITTGGSLNNGSSATIGSTTVVSAGDNVVFIWGASNTWYWDKLAATVDLSAYLTSTDAASTYTAKSTAYSSSSAGVALGGTSESPTITVTGGSISSGNASVVTGGTVYAALGGKQNALTTSSVNDGTLAQAIGFDSSNNLVKGSAPSGDNQKIKVGSTTFDANDTINFAAGTGLSVAATTTSGSETVTYSVDTSTVAMKTDVPAGQVAVEFNPSSNQSTTEALEAITVGNKTYIATAASTEVRESLLSSIASIGSSGTTQITLSSAVSEGDVLELHFCYAYPTTEDDVPFIVKGIVGHETQNSAVVTAATFYAVTPTGVNSIALTFSGTSANGASYKYSSFGGAGAQKSIYIKKIYRIRTGGGT